MDKTTYQIFDISIPLMILSSFQIKEPIYHLSFPILYTIVHSKKCLPVYKSLTHFPTRLRIRFVSFGYKSVINHGENTW